MEAPYLLTYIRTVIKFNLRNAFTLKNKIC